MAAHDATVEVETWAFRERELPRVPPDGWATTDRLRRAVCLAVECSVDGIVRLEPFSGTATERERFDAAVTADEFDHEHVRAVDARPTSGSDSDAEHSDAGGARNDGSFEERTEQFDIDDALDRL